LVGGCCQGGAITAALFLQRFVSKDVEWAHMDIAGPVWDAKQAVATGFGVATVAEWIQANADAS
jgi:leucyl aminopeptidase